MSDNIPYSKSAEHPDNRDNAGRLFYPLNSGAIDNWLVAGPHAIPLAELASGMGTEFGNEPFSDQAHFSSVLRRARAGKSFLRHPSQETALAPAERDTLEVGETTLTWRAYRCLDDHFVDLSAFYRTWHYAQAWAYAQLVCPAGQPAKFILTTNGPTDIWLNGQHILQHEERQRRHTIPIHTSLQAGHNRILARLETVARGESPRQFALTVADAAVDSWSVCQPTRIAPLDRRQELERLFEEAYLDRDVYTAQDRLEVYWPDKLDPSSDSAPSDLELRLQTPDGRIYMMARASTPHGNDSTTVDMGTALRAPEGACHLVLMPEPEEYSLGGMRIQRTLGIHVSKNPYAELSNGVDQSGSTYPDRRLEALVDATRRQGNLFSEIAKMALESWSQVGVGVIQQTIADLNQGAADGDCPLVGLLGMLTRFGDNPSFPPELKQPLADCVRNFPYWPDEPRQREIGGLGESRQILQCTGQILAGQLYPERTFANSGRPGKWHREEGETGAITWLLSHGRNGFEEWDSNTMLEAKVVALIHLVDLAENDEVRELAAVVLDKLFFSLALNSYRGAFGSTQGTGGSLAIRNARVAPSSGLSRLLWGMGVFNEHVMGSVSLACSDIYILPPIIEAIAADLPEAMWNRERHSRARPEKGDQAAASWEVNKVTYKTPDYMLCSAQDYLPGQPGSQEHIWQATFGPDAVVFVNHPACLSEVEAHRPNCWRGNTILPRVAQWRDVLIAVHKLPNDDWLGFTHAYFPIYAFDEYELPRTNPRCSADEEQVRPQGDWAFARKGEGYLALTAAQGLTLTTRGEQAYRELRSYGQANIWLCHLGRKAKDGSFADFQRKILALEVDFAQLSVHCTTLREESLAFGWTGPLRVNGQDEAITGFKHYENPYCVSESGASQMELLLGEDALRLHYV